MQFAVPSSKCVYIHSYGYIGPRVIPNFGCYHHCCFRCEFQLQPQVTFTMTPQLFNCWLMFTQVAGSIWYIPLFKPSLIVCLCCHKLTKRTMGLWGTPLCLRSLWHSFKPTICKVHGFAVPWWRKLWRNPVKLILDFPYWNSRSSDDKKVLLVLFTLFEVFVISILRGYCNWWASFLYFFGVLFRRPASVYSPMGSWATSTATLHCMAQHIYYYI